MDAYWVLRGGGVNVADEDGCAPPWPLIDGFNANDHTVMMMRRARYGVVHAEHVRDWSVMPSSRGDVFDECANCGVLDDVIVGGFIGCSLVRRKIK